MEEIKNEDVIEKEVNNVGNTDVKNEVVNHDFVRLEESIKKLINENDILKKEILNIKKTPVNANPVIEEKAYEKHIETWKEIF